MVLLRKLATWVTAVVIGVAVGSALRAWWLGHDGSGEIIANGAAVIAAGAVLLALGALPTFGASER